MENPNWLALRAVLAEYSKLPKNAANCPRNGNVVGNAL